MKALRRNQLAQAVCTLSGAGSYISRRQLKLKFSMCLTVQRLAQTMRADLLDSEGQRQMS